MDREDNQTSGNNNNEEFNQSNDGTYQTSREHEGHSTSGVQAYHDQESAHTVGDHQQQANNSNHNRSGKKQSAIRTFMYMLIAAILGSAITIVAVMQLDVFQPDGHVPKQDSTPVNAQDDTNNEVKETAQPVTTNGSVADIVDTASDAIVGIVNMGDEQNPFTQTTGEVERGVGSGVIYNVTDDGAYIVTNNHVIEDASSLKVSLSNGDDVDGELVGTDPLTDIAVVKIEGDFDISPIQLGDSDQLRAGDSVIAIGNPLGLDLSRTVTQGIVSATERTIPVETSAGEWELELIQTDAAINKGNSGGALLNNSGELVGINTLKIGNNGVEGLGFSIPSNEVSQIIDKLVDDGKVVRPYVGIGLKSVQDIPPYYLPKNLPDDVKEGIVVLSVDEDSAAAKAGIEVEDVIIGINDKEVKTDKDFRTYLYKDTEVGDTIKIELYHDGESKTVEVTLTSNAEVE